MIGSQFFHARWDERREKKRERRSKPHMTLYATGGLMALMTSSVATIQLRGRRRRLNYNHFLVLSCLAASLVVPICSSIARAPSHVTGSDRPKLQHGMTNTSWYDFMLLPKYLSFYCPVGPVFTMRGQMQCHRSFSLRRPLANWNCNLFPRDRLKWVAYAWLPGFVYLSLPTASTCQS